MAGARCESPLRIRFAKTLRGSQAPTRECTVSLGIAPSVVSMAPDMKPFSFQRYARSSCYLQHPCLSASQCPLPSALPPTPTLRTRRPGFTSNSTGAPARRSLHRGMRLEVAATTPSRLAHCSRPRSSGLRVISTRNFCRARNNLAFRVAIPTPRISAVSLTVRSSSRRQTTA
jgi:hypothetical protein